MLTMQQLRLQLGILLASDPTTLAPAGSANLIALIVAPFVLSENLAVGSLTLASFTGSTPIAGVTGAQLTGVDPVTGEQIVTIKEPVGGYRWVVGGSTGLPVTVYGFALLDSTLATLLAVQQLIQPVTLTATGQVIDVTPVTMRIVLQPVS